MKRDRYVVVVTDRRVIPAWSGNRRRILGLLRCLRGAGRRVALVGSDLGADHRLEAEVDEVVGVDGTAFVSGDIDRFDVGPYRRALDTTVAALRADVVIAEYAWMAPAMSNLPASVRRCVDCHDLLHERSRRFMAAGMHPWVHCTWHQERRRLCCADVLIAIQPRDEAVLRTLLPDKRVVCVTPFVDLPKTFQPQPADTLTVLAVGGDHAGNEGICQFADGPWSKVVAQLPGARLEVVGAIASRVPDRPGVMRVGQVDDLDRHYSAAAVVVCPVIVGTGLKIKMVEALRFGKAVVATPAAAEGLSAPIERAWATAASVDACGDAVLELLKDRLAKKRLEDAAFAYGQQHLSWDAAMSGVRSVLEDRAPGRFRGLMSLTAKRT